MNSHSDHIKDYLWEHYLTSQPLKRALEQIYQLLDTKLQDGSQRVPLVFHDVESDMGSDSAL